MTEIRHFYAFVRRALFALFVVFITNTAMAWTTHFTITTTSTDSFQFNLSAAGTFYVDCGSGGTLTSSDSTN